MARAGVVLPKINVLLSKEHSFHKFFEASFQGSGQSAEIFRKLEEGGDDETRTGLVLVLVTNGAAGVLEGYSTVQQDWAMGGLLSPGGKSEIITTLQKDT